MTWNNTWLWLALIAALGFGTWGCTESGDDDDDSAGDDDAGDDDAGDDDAGDDDAAADAMVSGTAGRETSTCPPYQDGMGTLCMFLLQTCADLGTEVASGEVASADMSFPTNTVDFDISDVPDGTFQLFGFLDDDDSGCAGGETTGDFFVSGDCVEVVVSGQQDVSGVSITFDAKCP